MGDRASERTVSDGRDTGKNRVKWYENANVPKSPPALRTDLHCDGALSWLRVWGAQPPAVPDVETWEKR